MSQIPIFDQRKPNLTFYPDESYSRHSNTDFFSFKLDKLKLICHQMQEEPKYHEQLCNEHQKETELALQEKEFNPDIPFQPRILPHCFEEFNTLLKELKKSTNQK